MAPEQGLITLETEKATMDVPSPAAGRVGELKVKVGDRVSTGNVILSLETEDAVPRPRRRRSQPAAACGEPPAATARRRARARLQRATIRAAARAGFDRPVGRPERHARVAVPDLGDFADVEIIEVLVKPGDRVSRRAGARHARDREGEHGRAGARGRATIARAESESRRSRVNAGDPLLVLRPTGRAAAAAAAPSDAHDRGAASAPVAPSARCAAARRGAAAAPRAAAAAPHAATAATTSFGEAHASPSVRKLARELGVELGRVRGTGRKGRITADDVKAFVKEVMRGGGAPRPRVAAVPDVDFAKFGEIATEPLTRIQKISGPRLHASWVNIPHVTQHDEADITELEELRAALKDAGAAARHQAHAARVHHARVRARARGDAAASSRRSRPTAQNLVVKQYTHIGFAADTPNGLVVPVIRDADKKDIYELARALATLSEKARAGKLGADEIQGGVFTVSSLGGIGGTVLHADHQCARGRDPRRVAQPVAAGLSRRRVRPAPDVAAVAVVRPPRHRRRQGRALHDAARRDPRGRRRSSSRRFLEHGAVSDVEVRVPDLGDFNDVDVIDVLVKPGDRVAPKTR